MAEKSTTKKSSKNYSIKRDKYIQVCPQCKSPDVFLDKTNPLQPAMGVPAMYICNKYAHSGNYFPEVKLSKLKGFKEEIEKNHHSDIKKDNTPIVDISYGNFIVRVFWKILALLVVICSIFLLFKWLYLGIILLGIGIFMIYITYFRMRKIKN